MAASIALGLCCMASTAVAGADRRELDLHNVNTGEDLRIVYKVDGAYDQKALRKLEWFFRDWRLSKTTTMDPHLFDLLERVYAESGSRATINVHSGYRSAQTNAMLRTSSAGVARESQHIEGKAIDFHIPDVPVKKLREIAIKVQGGGVGYYPQSRSPFVHIDVADVRAWPRPTRQYLASLFPDGKTVHIPSDGRPLPGYEEAKAEITGRKLGILAVIGDFKSLEYGRNKLPKSPAGLAFAPPIPQARPAGDPATDFMRDPGKAVATHTVAPQASASAFADVLRRREQLRTEIEASRPLRVEKPIAFRSVEVSKSARLATR
jgi:uncharacterized protein YcbK (DUF882 family)